jgi:uncharacterized glyoxalase superfamily protein PhnB
VSELPRFDLIDIIARDYDATIAFYRRLGLEVHDGPEGEIRHSNIEFGDVEIHIDNEYLAGLYNSSWRSGEQPRVIVGFRVQTREAVDAQYADLIDAGYAGVQEPYDAFWGARYAIVADPDGNHVGFMSPIDDNRKYWPPTPARAPDRAT